MDGNIGMNTSHDNLPHPVPPFAWLRWKENYFFIIKAPASRVFGIVHFNFEPANNSGRFNCNFEVEGRSFRYFNQIPFPQPFEYQSVLGDDTLKLTIRRDHCLALTFCRDDLAFDVVFEPRFAVFDYVASGYAAPELTTVKDVMTFGTNMHYNHVQQAMRCVGTVRTNGRTIAIDGYGYRDHSWSMRSDNANATHTWSGISFPHRTFGVITLRSLIRPEVEAKEGYVVDADGARALRSIEVIQEDCNEKGFPKRIVHLLRDVFGREYRIESDTANLLAQVPLAAENAQALGVYEITENFCNSIEVGEDAAGLAMIELGRHSTLGGV